MRRGEVENLLKFWWARQAELDPQDIFRWKQILVGRDMNSFAAAAYPKSKRRRRRPKKGKGKAKAKEEIAVPEPTNMTQGDVELEPILDPNLDPALQLGRINLALPGHKQTSQVQHNSEAVNGKDIHGYAEYWDPNINLRLPTHPPPTYPYFAEGTSSTAKHIIAPVHMPPHPRPLQTIRQYPNRDVPDDHFLHHRAQVLSGQVLG